MPGFVSILLTSMAAVWLLLDQIMKRRLRDLSAQLPAAYETARAAAGEDAASPSLILLSIDLLRKQHCTLPFAALSATEQHIALQAFGVEQLPSWMSRYAARNLRGPERVLITQLRGIKTSRPDHPKVHFGGLQSLRQLRSAEKP